MAGIVKIARGLQFPRTVSHCADTACLQRGRHCVRYNTDFLKGE
ncbi:hypothetical protein [Ralstonia pseudosolanacearum]|nr:hypothetical protein [Ralstonia pseudosolanacearum]MDO3587056.1 hypothetical protein [Ralstonia pseudosolanacearum]